MTTISDKIFQRAEQNALDYQHGSIDAYQDCASIIETLAQGCREDAAAAVSSLEQSQFNAHVIVLTAVARKNSHQCHRSCAHYIRCAQ